MRQKTPLYTTTNYNYFCNISFSRALPYDINIMSFFNSGLIFGPEVFILYKKYDGRGSGAVDLDTPPIKYVRWSFLPKWSMVIFGKSSILCLKYV